MYSDYKKVCLVYKENLLLSDYTTFGIGGIAKFVLFPSSVKELVSVLNLCHARSEKYEVIGNGSNLLISDKGVKDIVIFTRKLNGYRLQNNYLIASCGAKLPALCNLSCQRSLSGLEFSCGIPATLGGAIKMNAGAYGHAIGDVTKCVYVWENGEVFSKKVDFSYRKSSITSSQVVLGAKLLLEHDDIENINQRICSNRLLRQNSQPMEKSAGSIFLKEKGVSAGYLIDQAGLKGYSIGGAEVSTKHAGFIVNKKNATSSDVVKLINEIKKVVYGKFGINLKTEIRMLGEFDETIR